MSISKTVCLDCRSQNCHRDNHRLLSWSPKLTVPAKGNDKAWKLIESGDLFWDKRKVSRKAQNRRISNERNRIARLAEKRRLRSHLRVARERLLTGGAHLCSSDDFVKLVEGIGDDTPESYLKAVAYRIFGHNDELETSEVIGAIERYLARP